MLFLVRREEVLKFIADIIYMKVTVYNQKAEDVEHIDAGVFDVAWKPKLVLEVYRGMRANVRKTIAHTKGRGDIRGGGKKPWRQKGTGRARHGSSRSPIWRGGGVTHGPLKEKVYSVKINIKARRVAFQSLLAQKIRGGEVLAVDSLSFLNGKTKSCSIFLRYLGEKLKIPIGAKGGRLLICTSGPSMHVLRVCKNIPYVDAKEFKNLNITDLLNNKYILIEKDCFKIA